MSDNARMKYNAKLFLAQSHAEGNVLLQEAIKNKRAAFWDNILVTAASGAQAEVYRHLINDRIAKKHVPANCNYFVLPDRDDSRVGSGGALLCALARLLENCGGSAEKLARQKNLVLNSGGAAKRLPHSAGWGKLFALSGSHIGGDPANPPATVFDDLCCSFAGVPTRMAGGLLVVAADAFFRFSHTQLDLSAPCAVAISARAPAKTGSQHGVYLHRDGIVTDFLHKLSEDELADRGAVSDSGEVDLDIGAAYFGEQAIRTLLGLIANEKDGKIEIDGGMLAQYANPDVNLSLYADIIYPMAANSTLDGFVAQDGDGPPSEKLASLRPALFGALRSCELRFVRLSPGLVRNMGTTEEAIESLTFFRDEAMLGKPTGTESGIALNSKIPKRYGRADCFIEDSIVSDGASIGAECLVSGAELPAGFVLPDATALHMVLLKTGEWVCRVWGIRDDVKGLGNWLGYRAADFDGDAKSLWDAKLFPVCESQEDALRFAQLLVLGKIESDAEALEEWKGARKLSLSDIEGIDLDFMLEKRKGREDHLRAEAFAREMLGGAEVGAALGFLGSGVDAYRRIRTLQQQLASGKFGKWNDAMRLHVCLAEAAEKLALHIDSDELRAKGFRILKKASQSHAAPRGGASPFVREKAEARLPVRVNLAGTWSDAPPHCFERGGTMLNMAVRMNGKLPVRVSAEVIGEPVVELSSLHKRGVFRETEELLAGMDDLADPFVLSKAALFVSGVISKKGSLRAQLKKLGGGIRIAASADIPQGSGLGTSSILTGGIISALCRLAGSEPGPDELSNRVLVAEQLMTSGGGWQDVIGGMYPGIKITATQPGLAQVYEVSPLPLDGETEGELARRGFLMYTGQRRLARPLLVRVMSGYICNRPESIAALEATQRLVYDMAFRLRKRDVTAFGGLLAEHMRLMRILDGSCSNLMLDHFMEELGEYAVGSTLLGAGGGGFLYGVLRPDAGFQDLRDFVGKEYGGTAVEVYSCELAGAPGLEGEQ